MFWSPLQQEKPGTWLVYSNVILLNTWLIATLFFHILAFTSATNKLVVVDVAKWCAANDVTFFLLWMYLMMSDIRIFSLRITLDSLWCIHAVENCPNIFLTLVCCCITVYGNDKQISEYAFMHMYCIVPNKCSCLNKRAQHLLIEYAPQNRRKLVKKKWA